MAQSFKSAFAAARKGGKKTFAWKGKQYTTELAAPKKTGDTAPLRGLHRQRREQELRMQAQEVRGKAQREKNAAARKKTGDTAPLRGLNKQRREQELRMQAQEARWKAQKESKAAARRLRREAAESATGDGVADDIRQAAPMWQRGRGAIHERPTAGPPTGVGGVVSPGLSSRKSNVPTGAGDFPVYKGAPAQNFRTAFAAARKGGKKTFTWQGRKYTTDVA